MSSHFQVFHHALDFGLIKLLGQERTNDGLEGHFVNLIGKNQFFSELKDEPLPRVANGCYVLLKSFTDTHRSSPSEMRIQIVDDASADS